MPEFFILMLGIIPPILLIIYLGLNSYYLIEKDITENKSITLKYELWLKLWPFNRNIKIRNFKRMCG